MALEASVKELQRLKLEEMKPAMAEAQEWIEAVTETKMEGSFEDWLRSGVILCQLANKIAPGVIRRVNKQKMPFMQMENISNFLRVIKAMGVPEESCFDTVDLFKGSDIGKVVQTVHAFGSHVQTNYKKYTGPQLGVKLASQNKREFTAEQLAHAKVATSKINQGSSNTMERSEISKQGITFGNASSGAGDTNEISKAIAGSATVMERSEVSRPGITFGHDSAGGSGAADAANLTSGSATIMERSEVMRSGITFGHDQSCPPSALQQPQQ